MAGCWRDETGYLRTSVQVIMDRYTQTQRTGTDEEALTSQDAVLNVV